MPGVCSREKCSRSAFKFDYVGFSENDVGLYLSSMDNARCCPYMSIVHYEVIGGLECRCNGGLLLLLLLLLS